jgi:uncharacterized protein (TIGR02145 family)
LSSLAQGIYVYLTNGNIESYHFSNISKISFENMDSLYYGEASTATTVTDFDGNIYQIVEIGNQTWMLENLRTTHFANGTPILKVSDNTTWGNLGDNNTDKAYCWYSNDSIAYSQSYGALYTWAAAMNGTNSSSSNPSEVQGVCPNGWHMPSDNEWKELEMFIGMTQKQADQNDYRGTDEGKKIKEAGTDQWSSNNGTNSSGFTALPSGGRFPDSGAFAGLTTMGFWWTATEKSSTKIWVRCLFSGSKVWRNGEVKSEGFSIRCVKN